jgi:hypothetical protein
MEGRTLTDPRSGNISGKHYIDLVRPVECQHHCLPHAAMNLGNHPGYGIQPKRLLVHRLVIQPSMGAWQLFRVDDRGGYVGDSWHPSFDDAMHQARHEFGSNNLMPSSVQPGAGSPKVAAEDRKP